MSNIQISNRSLTNFLNKNKDYFITIYFMLVALHIPFVSIFMPLILFIYILLTQSLDIKNIVKSNFFYFTILVSALYFYFFFLKKPFVLDLDKKIVYSLSVLSSFAIGIYFKKINIKISRLSASFSIGMCLGAFVIFLFGDSSKNAEVIISPWHNKKHNYPVTFIFQMIMSSMLYFSFLLIPLKKVFNNKKEHMIFRVQFIFGFFSSILTIILERRTGYILFLISSFLCIYSSIKLRLKSKHILITLCVLTLILVINGGTLSDSLRIAHFFETKRFVLWWSGVKLFFFQTKLNATTYHYKIVNDAFSHNNWIDIGLYSSRIATFLFISFQLLISFRNIEALKKLKFSSLSEKSIISVLIVVLLSPMIEPISFNSVPFFSSFFIFWGYLASLNFKDKSG